MRALLVGVVVEVLVAMLLAGLVLGLAIPLLNRADLITIGDVGTSRMIAGVMLGLLLIALFRPGSAIHRHIRR